MRRPQLTIRGLMIGIVAASLAFAILRFANELRYWTFSHGWNTSVLGVGWPVVIDKDIPFGETIIPAGTRGIVVADPPDEDSAYPDRLVGVEITEGSQKGLTGMVKRVRLRVR